MRPKNTSGLRRRSNSRLVSLFMCLALDSVPQTGHVCNAVRRCPSDPSSKDTKVAGQGFLLDFRAVLPLDAPLRLTEQFWQTPLPFRDDRADGARGAHAACPRHARAMQRHQPFARTAGTGVLVRAPCRGHCPSTNLMPLSRLTVACPMQSTSSSRRALCVTASG